MMTWAEMCERLGLSRGTPSAEIVRRATASARHQARVDKAVEAAYDAAPNRDRAQAWALLVADIVGIGGKLGLEGAATTRLPCFRGLGRGRKQTYDGPAWSAAILEAARLLQGSGDTWFRLVPLPPARIGVQEGNGEPRPVSLPSEWAVSVAGFGLLTAAARALNVEVPLVSPDYRGGGEQIKFLLTAFDGAAKDWAEVYDIMAYPPAEPEKASEEEGEDPA